MEESKASDALKTQGNKALESVTDTLSDLVTGIPAPVRKNALRAFAQLCTAAIDVPVAHLEGIAAEKRAATEARLKLISTGSTLYRVYANF